MLASSYSKQSGVTLIELLVTLSVFFILLGIAVPSLASMKVSGDLSTAHENLAQQIRYARSVAMAQGTIATVTVDHVAKTSTLSVLNGSFANKVFTLPDAILFGASASVSFDANGQPSLTGTFPISMTVNGYTAIAARTINLNLSGQVDAQR